MSIKQRIQQRRWNLIISALLIVGVVELTLRESRVEAAFAQLAQRGTDEQAQAVEDLVEGCQAKQWRPWLPSYLAERLFGNCRSLSPAPLTGANLSDANLSNAVLSSDTDLSNADLSSADLSNAVINRTNLNYADLSNADLSGAALINADLRDTDLSNADLNNTIALSTDLRSTQGLTQQQLVGNSPPLICNSPLPEGIEIDKNRDCDRLASALLARYPEEFDSIEAARAFVNRERQQR